MEKIKNAIERSSKALEATPALGLGTGRSRVRMGEGLTCEVEDGKFRLRVDMPEGVGGGGGAAAPPGHGRAARGRGRARGDMMRAASLGVPISSLEVEVEADYDDGALLGVGGAPPGYLEVRTIVTVESPAPEADVMRVLDEGDARSPYLDVFRRAQPCRREVRINPPRPARG